MGKLQIYYHEVITKMRQSIPIVVLFPFSLLQIIFLSSHTRRKEMNHFDGLDHFVKESTTNFTPNFVPIGALNPKIDRSIL